MFGIMLEVVKSRLESPTSILTHMQCPRRYYYRYIKRLEQKPSIYLVMGGIVHSTIGAFHRTDLSEIPSESFLETLRSRTMEDLDKRWFESREEFDNLNLSPDEVNSFYNDARSMITNFCKHHINKLIACQHHYNISGVEAFRRLRPKTETKIISERLGVMGVIDAIHNFNGETVIIDYKTSKKNDMSSDCMVQLAIYSLLYRESQGRIPDKVGVHFLRHGEKVIPTTPELLALGEEKCNEIRNLVRSENEAEYPRKVSGLCMYRSGQCDHYEICMPNRKENTAVEIESDRKRQIWC